jgi:methyl-accepting chemotaxis protein
MNFSDAIRAHANWRLRLSTYCQGNLKETFSVQVIAKDNACDLGKWLYGEGSKYASDPKFGELISTHAAFHRSAAEITAMVQSSRQKDAEKLLNSNESQYAKLSVQVVGMLMKFRTHYGDK